MSAFNKRAQMSKFLAGVPTLLVVLALVGLFIGASFTLALVKRVPGSVARMQGGESRLLYEQIRVDNREVIVIDALLLHDAGKLAHTSVEQGLAGLMEQMPDNSCLLAAQGRDPKPGGRPGGAARNDFYLEKREGKVKGAHPGTYPSVFKAYRDAGALSSASVLLQDGRRMHIESYLGECTL